MTDLMTAILTGAVVLARYTWSPFMSIGSLRRFVAVFETIKGMVDDMQPRGSERRIHLAG